MLNTEDFIKRLESILDFYNLNASAFADKITIQRSSMSHLLSGRNKPSLDFVLKIVAFFPEVDLDWILTGKGIFPKKTEIEEKTNPKVNASNLDSPMDLFSQMTDAAEVSPPVLKSNQSQNPLKIEEMDEAEKIIVFYKNGTFKMYSPR